MLFQEPRQVAEVAQLKAHPEFTFLYPRIVALNYVVVVHLLQQLCLPHNLVPLLFLHDVFKDLHLLQRNHQTRGDMSCPVYSRKFAGSYDLKVCVLAGFFLLLKLHVIAIIHLACCLRPVVRKAAQIPWASSPC
eukprot:CAMPEP_0181331056 /NCGR_PEP_ID=MMETSP1101-20121128/24274_1 /TAXON_ID=46948 /ORGANISM="Rhodomonas abbreviata, Strain Caron Lab Isolate" /LENGTH=133 /DNA_ID=CAMNT_0023440443 /DNA_START=421 /DNA_END=822 /DNA_ORIENTATION=-